MERVTFTSLGDQVVGSLYMPDGAPTNRPAPAVVITGA
jgi:hypothetical protein